jgi:hypothetical protein
MRYHEAKSTDGRFVSTRSTVYNRTEWSKNGWPVATGTGHFVLVSHCKSNTVHSGCHDIDGRSPAAADWVENQLTGNARQPMRSDIWMAVRASGKVTRVATTSRAVRRFRVAESSSDRLWIVMERLKGDKLQIFSKAIIIGFDLPRGTTLERAKEIAWFLNNNLTQVSETV